MPEDEELPTPVNGDTEADESEDDHRTAAIEAFRDGFQSLRQSVGHIDDWLRDLRKSLPTSLRLGIWLFSLVIVDFIVDQIQIDIIEVVKTTINEALSASLFEFNLFDIFLFILLLQYFNFAINLVGFNALLEQMNDMERSGNVPDGGTTAADTSEQTTARRSPTVGMRVFWLSTILVFALLGYYVGRGYGNIGGVVFAGLGAFLGDEFYHALRSGKVFHIFNF